MGTILLANLKGASLGLGSKVLLSTPRAEEEVIDGVGIAGGLRVGPDDTVVAGIRGMLWSDTGRERGAGGSVTHFGPGWMHIAGKRKRKVC